MMTVALYLKLTGGYVTFLKVIDDSSVRRTFVFDITNILLCYLEHKNELYVDTPHEKYKFVYVSAEKFAELEAIYSNQEKKNLIEINLQAKVKQ